MLLLVIFILVFMLLSALRVPVAFSMGIGVLASFLIGGLPVNLIPAALFSGLDSFALLAIPAFIYSGDIMGGGGISRSLVNFFAALFGRFRGSLCNVLIATSALFGTIVGSSVATVSAVGGIMVPEMLKRGYDKKQITALLAATGFLGILIPPSISGIIYSLATGQRILEVWFSTIGAGLLLVILYMVANYIVYGRKLPKVTEPFVFGKFVREFAGTLPMAAVAMIMPVIIFGGVYGGVFTATEAGAVAVVYGLFAGWVIFPLLFKSKPDGKLFAMTRKSVLQCASIAIALSAAAVVGRMVALAGVVTATSEFLLNVTESRIVFLIIVNIILLICGMILDPNVTILIFAPIMAPIADVYGVDPIHFAAIMLLNLGVGLITPPLAGNIFVACKVTGSKFGEVIKPIMPFFLCAIIALILITYIPAITLFFVQIVR